VLESWDSANDLAPVDNDTKVDLKQSSTETQMQQVIRPAIFRGKHCVLVRISNAAEVLDLTSV
jgi:hypothetical protein